MFRKKDIIVFLLFTIYLINGLIAIPRLSITYDEGDNLSYGIRILKGKSEKVKPYDDASTMPMLALNALPRAIQQVLEPSLQKTDNGESDIIAGRYISLLLCSLTGVFILRWATQLYGQNAGLLSLFLFVFCPNLNANNIFLTTDGLSALFTISTLYFFCQLLRNAKWANVCFFSVSLALAQLAKQSLTHLPIILILLFVVWSIHYRNSVRFTGTMLVKLFAMSLLVLIIINTGFLFRGFGQSLSQYQFRSSFFQSVQQNFQFIGDIPLPLAEPYLSGLDLTKNLDEMGTGLPETSGGVYILGELRTKTGFWYYYFVSLFFKTSVSVLLLFGVTLFFLLRKRKQLLFDEIAILFCIGYFLVYFNFFYNSQVGIRHILMLFPLAYVLIGKTADWLQTRRVLLFSVIAYSIVTFYIFFPNLFAYSNELLWPKKDAYRIIGYANIDYGQGYFLLNKYLKANPDVTYAPLEPKAGRFVINSSDYVDVYSSGKYDWLKRFKPIASVQHCFLLFEITEKDINSIEKR